MPQELKDLKEKQWQQLILDAARVLGWMCYHTYDSRRSAAGFPDLVMVRDGRLIFAELKTETGRVAQTQREWLAKLAKTGAEVYLWRPRDWDDVVDILQRDQVEGAA